MTRLGRALRRRWRGLRSDPITWAEAATVPRVAGRVSLIVGLPGLSARDLRHWSGVAGSRSEFELILVGRRDAAPPEALGPGVVVVPAQDVGRSGLIAAGTLASTGERLVLIGPGARVDAESLSWLTAALDDPAVAIVQPVEECPDTTIRSAGAYFAPGEPVPTPLLAGHATADAEPLGGTPLPAVHSAVVAMRAADLIALRGLDPRFDGGLGEVDLSLRATDAGLGRARLVPQATAVVAPEAIGPGRQAAAARQFAERWQHPPLGSLECVTAAGFVVREHRRVTADGGAAPVLEPLRSRGPGGAALRWTIDTAATAGWWGDAWGDTHFARSLAAALRRLGQHVAVDRRPARGRESRRLDDVVLVLRGLDRVEPVAGPINLLWVISHPDDVTAEEAAGFDAVFAASERWALQQSRAWGVPVTPLLQCVDATTFGPSVPNPDPATGLGQRPAAPPGRVVFVGNARRGARRPVVEAALQTGEPIDLYGTGWDELGTGDRVVATQIANDRVGGLYASARVVLNDHWEDMARHGFVSNRLFDAVACGARVLSDPVDGATELFEGCVQFASTPAEVAQLLGQPEAAWPDETQRLSVAERVRREHSFDERARRLLDHVLEQLEDRTQPRE
ncbi:MAG: glycosyltransferase [Propionibacteriaceae bacterium]|nr:glycosyltransferase [Propionibacteriaceae bacterium]